MRRRLLLAHGFLLLALLSARPLIVMAGEGDESGEPGNGGETPEGGAPADTSQVDLGEARRSGGRFSPHYTSKYDINRNTSTWTQSLSVGSWAGPVDVTNSTTVAIGKDTTLDRDRRNATTNFGFSYSLQDNLKVSSRLSIIRNQTVDAGRTDTSQDSESFDIESTYQRTMLGGLLGNFKVAGGTTHDKRTDPLTSARESTGPHIEGTADFTLTRGADWSLRTALRSSRLNSTEARTNANTRDRNLIGNLSFGVQFETPGFDQWNLTVGTNLNRNQYPIVSQDSTGAEIGLQETNKNLSRDLSLSTSMSPFERLDLSGSVSYRNNNVNREVDTERSQQSIDRAVDGNLAYMFPDSTQVEASYDWSVARSIFDPESRRGNLDGDTKKRGFGGLVRRPIGRKWKIDVAGNYELQSYVFDLPDSTKDDRDIVRGDFAARLDYNPYRKISTNIRFTLQHTQTIYINAERSGTNQTLQIYSIYPTLEYRITPRITFREEGAVIANATVFNFDEDKNRLSRTSELRSTIDARVHPRVRISLRHSHRFLQDGSYRRGEDGVRRFGKSRDDTSRDLTFRTDYTPFGGATMYFRSNRRVSDTISVQVRGGQTVEVKSSSEFNEIEMGGRVDRTLSMGLKIGANVRRLQSWNTSNVRNNYWVGSIDVGQQF